MGRHKKIKEEDINIVEESNMVQIEKKMGEQFFDKEALDKEIKLTKEQITRREKAREVMREINKSDKGITIDFGNTIKPFERQKFGHKSLDTLTNGGIKKGQCSTIWGDPDCGKTTIAYDMIATCQKEGGIAAYINMEQGYDPEYATKRGININELIIEDVVTAEQCLDSVIKLCNAKVVDLVVIDSVHGLSPKGEQYDGKTDEIKSTEKDTQALLARKLSQFFRMSSGYIRKANCAVLLIGQTRTAIGGYIALEALSGGRAIKHYSRLILHIRKGSKADAPTEKIVVDGKNENRIVGFNCVVKVDKSQIEGCTYLSEISFPFLSNQGIVEEV